MLNRNKFIDDFLQKCNEVIKRLKDQEHAAPRENYYPPSKYMADLINHPIVDCYHFDSRKVYSLTEFYLLMLYHFSPRDEGGFTIEEIEALLKKHQVLLEQFCLPNYDSLCAYVDNKSFSDQEDNELLNYANGLELSDEHIILTKNFLIKPHGECPDMLTLESLMCLGNHLYQRWLRQEQFQLYREAIEVYVSALELMKKICCQLDDHAMNVDLSSLKQHPTSKMVTVDMSYTQQRLNTLIDAALKSNSLKKPLSSAEINHYLVLKSLYTFFDKEIDSRQAPTEIEGKLNELEKQVQALTEENGVLQLENAVLNCRQRMFQLAERSNVVNPQPSSLMKR